MAKPVKTVKKEEKPQQCSFAALSMTIPRCKEQATRKWGAFWFCEKHGSRK
jgi:hypothetical protein